MSDTPNTYLAFNGSEEDEAAREARDEQRKKQVSKYSPQVGRADKLASNIPGSY